MLLVKPVKAIGEAEPETTVPPTPALPLEPGVKPATPYSTIKALPPLVKLADAELLVTEPIP